MIHVMTQRKDIGPPQQTYTYAKSTIEAPEKSVKYVQSYQKR